MNVRASPIQQLMTTGVVDWDAFRANPCAREAKPAAASGPLEQAATDVMNRSLACVRDRLESNRLYDPDGRLSGEVLRDLGTCGYWGLRVGAEYGGSGASFREFAPFLSRMSTLAGAVAGLGSVHSCIGAVARLQMFGSSAQKQRLLPPLARGERLSAFALTEPNAGSDLTALRTRAVRDGDDLVVQGEKVFITNLDYGRTLALVCQLDGQPQVLVCELPAGPTDAFQLREYGLHALRRSINRGARFDGLRVPYDNLLAAPGGKGWPVIYQGLNQGRVALCANASGSLRRMLAGLIPWVAHRRTFGAPIAQRQLVRGRLARLAALIVGCDAIVAWTASLLDAGHRGEVESILAKVFGSEALREAAIDIAMKTHGGRSFLHGHAVGDNLYDWLAPSIYEGESDLLSLALLKHLTRRDSSAPIQLELRESGPVAQHDSPFANHVDRASQLAVEISREIGDWLERDDDSRQLRALELSRRVQRLAMLLCVAAYGVEQSCETTLRSADLLCRDLLRDLTYQRPSDEDLARADQLGQILVEGGHRDLVDLPPEPILFPYENG